MADFVFMNSDVTRILIDNDSYGGCLIYLESSPQAEGLACGNAVAAVTFDCQNTRGTTDKATAKSMLDSAYLNLVTPSTTRLRLKVLDEGTLPNGVCYAEWVSLIPE